MPGWREPQASRHLEEERRAPGDGIQVTDLHRGVTDTEISLLAHVATGVRLEAGVRQGVPVIAAASKSTTGRFNVHTLALASLAATALPVVPGDLTSRRASFITAIQVWATLCVFQIQSCLQKGHWRVQVGDLHDLR